MSEWVDKGQGPLSELWGHKRSTGHRPGMWGCGQLLELCVGQGTHSGCRARGAGLLLGSVWGGGRAEEWASVGLPGSRGGW